VNKLLVSSAELDVQSVVSLGELFLGMTYGPTGNLGLWGWTSPAPHWKWKWNQYCSHLWSHMLIPVTVLISVFLL